MHSFEGQFVLITSWIPFLLSSVQTLKLKIWCEPEFGAILCLYGALLLFTLVYLIFFFLFSHYHAFYLLIKSESLKLQSCCVKLKSTSKCKFMTADQKVQVLMGWRLCIIMILHDCKLVFFESIIDYAYNYMQGKYNG